ncbi:MAG: hypothetical protein KA371_17745 [Acidobacteria bacterium]|nr:hypothetical protein [Acidobacteriota bacterium]
MKVRRRRWTGRAVAMAVMWGLAAGRANAQQRPLVTEDPQTIGAGQILFETGVDWMRGITFPISGLRGDVVSGPTIGVSVGVGPIAEIQIDGSPYRQLRITERREAPLSSHLNFSGATTSAVDDFVIATKLRLLGEARGRPAIGLRFATRLPNASNESGLGHDTTDFFASFLLGKTVARVRWVANAGLAIVGDPIVAARQEDLLTFGLSLTARLGRGFDLVSEYNGRMNLAASSPVAGTENRGVARAGARFSRGRVRLDAAALIGATSTDLDFGATTGLTWVFRAFTMP